VHVPYKNDVPFVLTAIRFVENCVPYVASFSAKPLEKIPADKTKLLPSTLNEHNLNIFLV
jgi:hypothetical protein